MLNLKSIDKETIVIEKAKEASLDALVFDNAELSVFIHSSLDQKKNIFLLKNQIIKKHQEELLGECYLKKEHLQSNENYLFIPKRMRKQFKSIYLNSSEEIDWFSLS